MPTKKTTKYCITMHYNDAYEYGKHTLIEEWQCSGIDNLNRTLIGVLDLCKDEDGNLIKPNIKYLNSVLKQYADKKFIDYEFDRQKNAYSCYKKLMTGIKSNTNIIVKFDKQTTYSISSF